MTRKFLVADLLCGAGGTSTGCELAITDLGMDPELVCVNHWPTAIETHRLNHPRARHHVQDISTVRPHLIVPEGYLDLLTASPTCTHHSVARGGKPTSDQQRSDPWHIIPWFTELRVKRALIENVWEFTGWGPVDPLTGKPIKDRKGEYFHAWVDTIRKLGATGIEWRKLNAADYGEATTRWRLIMLLRFDGGRIVWAPATHFKRDATSFPLFEERKPWRPAREIIDWNLKGKSIFRRKAPLAPKTLDRILAGAVKFGWPQPLIDLIVPEINRSLRHVVRTAYQRRHHQKTAVSSRARKQVKESIARLRRMRGGVDHRGGAGGADPLLITLRRHADGRSVETPVPTLAASGQHLALAQPVVVRTNMHGRKSPGARGVQHDPLMTITTDGGIAFAEPVIMNGRKGNQPKGVSDEPVPTLDTKGGVWLAEPFILSQQNSGQARAVDIEPLPTILTGGAGASEHPGCARPMLVEPFIVTTAHGNDAHEKDPNSRRANSIDGRPLGAVHGEGSAYAIIEPFMLSREGGGAPRSVNEPTPTQVAKHSHVLISSYYSNGSGQTCSSAEEPLPSPTTKGRFGMVMPVTHSGTGDRARDVEEEPVPTITTAHRGELAFISAQFGEREGQAPRVHDIDQPAPSPTATGHINLVEAAPDYDILFRMLEVHELAAAMGFNEPTEGRLYKFAGTKTDGVKQVGNAVSVRKVRAVVRTFVADAIDDMSEAA